MAENQLNQSQVEFSQTHAKQKTAMKSARYVHMLISVITKAFGVDGYLSNTYPGKNYSENKMHVVFTAQKNALKSPLTVLMCYIADYKRREKRFRHASNV